MSTKIFLELFKDKKDLEEDVKMVLTNLKETMNFHEGVITSHLMLVKNIIQFLATGDPVLFIAPYYGFLTLFNIIMPAINITWIPDINYNNDSYDKLESRFPLKNCKKKVLNSKLKLKTYKLIITRDIKDISPLDMTTLLQENGNLIIQQSCNSLVQWTKNKASPEHVQFNQYNYKDTLFWKFSFEVFEDEYGDLKSYIDKKLDILKAPIAKIPISSQDSAVKQTEASFQGPTNTSSTQKESTKAPRPTTLKAKASIGNTSTHKNSSQAPWPTTLKAKASFQSFTSSQVSNTSQHIPSTFSIYSEASFTSSTGTISSEASTSSQDLSNNSISPEASTSSQDLSNNSISPEASTSSQDSNLSNNNISSKGSTSSQDSNLLNNPISSKGSTSSQDSNLSNNPISSKGSTSSQDSNLSNNSISPEASTSLNASFSPKSSSNDSTLLKVSAPGQNVETTKKNLRPNSECSRGFEFVHCKGEKYGCKQVCSEEALQIHEANCKFVRVMACYFPGCNIQVAIVDYSKHLTTHDIPVADPLTHSMKIMKADIQKINECYFIKSSNSTDVFQLAAQSVGSEIHYFVKLIGAAERRLGYLVEILVDSVSCTEKKYPQGFDEPDDPIIRIPHQSFTAEFSIVFCLITKIQ